MRPRTVSACETVARGAGTVSACLLGQVARQVELRHHLRPVPFEEHGSAPNVDAGEGLKRGKGVEFVRGRGTAGLVVTPKLDGTTPLDPELDKNKTYLVTADHVLGPDSIYAETDSVVYAPELSKCSKIECNDPIGSVVSHTLRPRFKSGIQKKQNAGGVDYAVDAALIALDTQDATNVVPERGLIGTVRALIDKAEFKQAGNLPSAKQFAVWKYGATTGLTKGKVVAVASVALTFDVEQPVEGDEWDGQTTAMLPVDGTGLLLEVEGEADPAVSDLELELELDRVRMLKHHGVETAEAVEALFDNTPLTAEVEGWPDAPTLHLTGNVFSMPGDSGAPVLADNNNDLIGFIQGGAFVPVYLKDEKDAFDVRIGRSHVVFAEPCLGQLQVDLKPNTGPSKGRPAAAPGTQIRSGSSRRNVRHRLTALQRRMERSADGRLLAAAFSRHFEEVRQLIHHRRRVLVTWHRMQGPSFLAAVLTDADNPKAPWPSEFGGVSRLQLVHAMRHVLFEEGSAGLRQAIERHEALLFSALERANCVEEALGSLTTMSVEATPICTSGGIPGSADVLVRDGSGSLFLLTAHHIAFADGTASAIYDTRDPSRPIGEVLRGELGRVTGTRGTVFVDCALIRTDRHPADRRCEVMPAEQGAIVQKWGAATGHTVGTIRDAAFYDRPLIDGVVHRAPGQILVRPDEVGTNFAAPGDSGAGLYDLQGRLIGLLWGVTASGEGVACPIGDVLSVLQVELAGGCA